MNPDSEFLGMSDKVAWPVETYTLVLEIERAVTGQDRDTARLLLARLDGSSVFQGDALNPISRLELLAFVANVHIRLEDYVTAMSKMEEVCTYAASIDPNNVKTALDYQALAGLKERCGDLPGALEAIETGIRYLEGVRGFTRSSPYYIRLDTARSRLLASAAERCRPKRPWWAFWRKG